MYYQTTVGIRKAMGLIMLDLDRTYNAMSSHTLDREYVEILVDCFGMGKPYRYIDYNGVTVECNYNVENYTVTFTYTLKE